MSELSNDKGYIFTFRPTGGFVDIVSTSHQLAEEKVNQLLNAPEVKELFIKLGISDLHIECDLVSKETAQESSEHLDCESTSNPINTPFQLVGIQEEFTNSLAVTCDNTLRLSKPVTNAARKLVQHSTKDYSIVVPDTIECVQAGDGSGDWVPALVFVPNEAVTETYCEVLKENGNKVLHIQVERSLFQRLMDIDVCRSNFSPDHFNISVNELVAEIIQAHFVHYDANEILSFDYVEVIRV